MGPRPAHIQLHDHDDATGLQRPPKTDFHLDLPSPRVGEIPPALSPLDAFAMQSRLLAKQFEQEQQNGRRISRLPPVMVQKEFLNRPDYFRSVSGGSDGAASTASNAAPSTAFVQESSPTSPTGLGVTPGSEHERPISHYPMFGHASKPSRASPLATPYFDAEEDAGHGYFGVSVPRASSPEPVDPRLNIEAPSPLLPSLTSSVDSVQSSQPRTFTNGSTHSQRSGRSERGLYPPAYPKSPRSFQSIRSVPPDSGDEDIHPPSSAYATSGVRKFSSSSNKSRPQSPYSAYPPALRRSPSVTSDYSAHGAQALPFKQTAQRAYNFSRPMSSGGRSTPSVDTRPSLESGRSPRTSTEMPHRHPSGASDSTHPSTLSRHGSHDDVVTPYPAEHIESPITGQAAGGGYFPASDPSNGAPSYIHTKYALPRGKTVDRNSIGLSESWTLHQFSWDSNKPQAAEQPAAKERQDHESLAKALPVRPASPAGSENISGMRLSRRDLPISHTPTRSRSANPISRTENPPLHRASPSVQTESTDRTIRAVPLHERSESTELTPDEHLEVGIQAHTAGELNKSTYHLRLAALAGLPTAMLLYALACRHGWGMRANQEDGVMWLRKAIDTAGLEVVDVEATISSASARSPKLDPVAEAAERRKRKAQFALAIYELGMSYMNGWGCPRDKPLAVRCYEVAGSWGDADALAEAGFCYTQGVGVKKDLKRAAMLYRKAAVLGMSMAGNSWIYKAKYIDDNPITNTTAQKDFRSINFGQAPAAPAEKPRSRARSIWGRKKDKA